MASHKVQVQSGKKNVVINGVDYNAGDQVTVDSATFTALTSAGRFTDGTLTDLGPASITGNDDVFTAGVGPTLTSAAAAANPPTKVEFDKVVADLAALKAALTGSGKPFSS